MARATTTFSHNAALGQHFLRNAAVVRTIVRAARLQRDDVVVEIGPGDGVLTDALAAHAGRVVAVEKDERLIPRLRRRFAASAHVTILHADILRVVPADLVATQASPRQSYKVVANIPYYITAPIIRMLTECPRPPEHMVLMVQKEVGKRLTAAPGELSVLGVAAQYYCDVRYVCDVPRADFEPAPVVDSAVVTLTRRPAVAPDRDFFRVVRIGFSARRKIVVNNLANGLHLPKDIVQGMVRSVGLGADARAQDVTVAQWRALARAAKSLREEQTP